MDLFQFFLADAAGHETCRPYPCKPCREDMHEETADEFIRFKFHCFPDIGGAIVFFIAEPDALVIIAFDPAFRDGGAVCISGKVSNGSLVQLLATPWTAAYQAPPSMGFSRQEYWSGVPFPSLDIKVNSPQSLLF